MNLRDHLSTDGRSIAEQIEAAGIGPRLPAPTRESEHERHVRQFDRVETRQAAAFEINVHARGEGQKRFNEIQPPASPRADDARLSVVVLRAAQSHDVFPWFK